MSEFKRRSPGDLTPDMRLQLIRRYMEKARQALLDAEANAERSPDLAVNRACYAEFYAASALLLTQGKIMKKHKGVIGAFGENFVSMGIVPRDLGREIRELEEARLDADYSMEKLFSSEKAMEYTESARRFLAEIESSLRKIMPESLDCSEAKE